MKFHLQSQFHTFLCQTLFVFSQIKHIKHIDQNFHSMTWVMPHEWDLGLLGVKNLSMGFAMELV